MRRLLLFACALFGFIACTQNPIEEQSVIRTDAPETIRVGFEDNETRIQLNEAQKTVWTKDDLVSIFYKSDANQKWQYQGETGERVGDLKCVDAGTATESMKRVVVVYPYNENYYINTETYNVQATLPATQHYLANSYGTDGNIMVSSSEYNQFSLKSVCGWLKLQLTGDGDTIKSIKFRGNDGEQVAGLIYVDTATAEATLASEMGGTDDNNAGGNLVFDDTILAEVVLDCGDGVELGAEPTAFYIALPPQTFANGFTVEIEDTDGSAMEQSTAKTFVVERNTISPMAALEFIKPAQPTPANNEIWYTNGSTTEATKPYNTNVFGVNIVSNTYDAAKECWVIKFDGEVTSIGNYAFYLRSSLTSVTIPDSVTSIGDYAFETCSSLTSVNIPDSVTSIGDIAFNNCYSLTSITIPDSVTTIGEDAFRNCESLTSVTIGDRVTKIGERAFYECSSLTSVTIGDSVTTIGDYAFRYCESLTSVTIPDSVTEIGVAAFYNCSSLTSVTIPDSVTTIGEAAFYECTSLTSATIGDSVTTIGYCAFALCSNLQEFKGKFASKDGRCLIIDGVLNSFAIGCGATEYTIPDSVTTIGDRAFSECSSLTSVTIGDSVTTIGDYAFRSCSSLTSVTIGDSVTTIGERAFYECSSLTSVTIGDSVTTIGSYAFHYCKSLKSVYCKAITPPAGGSYMFYNNASGRKIYVPAESVDAYKSASGWSEYKSSIFGYDFENGVAVTPKPANNEIWYTNGSTTKATTPNDNTNPFGANIVSNTYHDAKECWVIKFNGKVTTIGNYAFSGCSSLTSVTIPDSVTEIGYGAFHNCSSLTSVTIPDSVITIGGGAFYNCKSLTSVTIPDSVTAIWDETFYGCSNLTSVTIGDSVTTIGEDAFWECNSLTSVTIGNSVTTIGMWAFYNCSSLTSVTIPDSVTTIEKGAFCWCESLTSVTIPDSVTMIGEYAFSGCSSLTSVTISDSVTSIGEGAFSYCDSLTSVTIPDSVTEIGYGAFAYCSSLTSVTIPDSVTTIGSYAFDGCTSLTSVTIPDSVTAIGDYAFRDCSSLKKVYCNATIPPSLGSNAFSSNATGRRIYVYEECVEVYKLAWSSYKDSIYTNGQNCPGTTIIEYTTTDGNTITSSKLPIISNSYDNGVGTMVISGIITVIPNSAFYSCSSLTSVTIPDSVTRIEWHAFYFCESLTSVTIPDSVTTIGWYAFYDCESLTSVTIPDSVTTIGKWAFSGCSSLTSVTIGDSVTSIGYEAFAGCSSLTSVYCKATTPPAGSYDMFSGNASGRKIYVPMGSVNKYKSASGWSYYASDIVGYYF